MDFSYLPPIVLDLMLLGALFTGMAVGLPKWREIFAMAAALCFSNAVLWAGNEILQWAELFNKPQELAVNAGTYLLTALGLGLLAVTLFSKKGKAFTTIASVASFSIALTWLLLDISKAMEMGIG